MSFVMDRARDFIANTLMESPRERDQVFEDHVRKSHRAAHITKETWAQPTRTWGFWNTDKNNMVYHFHLDPSFKKGRGRTDPYEDQLSK